MSFAEIMTIVLVIWIALNAIMLGVNLMMLCLSGEDAVVELLPNDLYSNTDMNYVSCWIISILAIICIPSVFLCSFLYWLTHVEIKKKPKD